MMTGSGNNLQARVLAKRGFRHRLSLPVRARDGHWLISFQDRPEVILLDGLLREVQRIDLQAQSQQSCATTVALSGDGRLFALSSRTELRIVSRSGKELRRIPHPAWYSSTGSNCIFDSKGRLWYVRPGDLRGKNDQLVILEPQSGAIVAEQTIQNEVGTFDLFLCPDEESVLIAVGCGQDGAFLYLARQTHSGLRIKQYPFADRTFVGGFAPNGREFATGALQGDAIKIHSFPSGRVLASIDRDMIFAGDDLPGSAVDAVGYQPIYLDSNRLLFETRFGRLVLLDRRLVRIAETICPAGCRLQGYDDSGQLTRDLNRIVDYQSGLTSLHAAGVGHVLTVHNENRLQLLACSAD